MKKTRFFGMMLFAFALATTACTNVNEPDPDPIGEKVTIYAEHFGTELGSTAPAESWPSVVNYTKYQKDGKGSSEIIYTSEGGTVTLRGNQPSSGYTGASGSANAMIAAAGGSLVVSKIATCGAKNLELSFGSIVVTDTLSVSYRISGTTVWNPLTYSKDKSGWGLVEKIKITLPAGTNTINLKFTAGKTLYGTRVDDILLTTTDITTSPVVDQDNTGVIGDTMSVAQAIANQNSEVKWVKGYIVGCVKNGVSTFETPTDALFGNFDSSTNVFIADNADETDYTKCLSVKLNDTTAPSDLRSTVNLLDNPSNKGKVLKVKGAMKAMFTNLKGCREIVDFKLAGYVVATGDFAVPEMSISELRSKWTGSQLILSDKKKIVGIVITDLVGGNSTSLKNLTIASADNSAGIIIRLAANSTYNLGDKIEIALDGLELNHYGLAIQLLNVPNAKTQKIGTGTVEPKVTTIADIRANYASYESRLVTVNGTVSSINGVWGGSTHQSNTLTSGSNEIKLFVSSFSTFKTIAIPTGEKSITGIVGQNTTPPAEPVYQLIIRNLNDVK